MIQKIETNSLLYHQQSNIKKLVISLTTKNKLYFSKVMILFMWLNNRKIIQFKTKMVNRNWLYLRFEISLKQSYTVNARSQFINQLTNKKNTYIKKLPNTYTCRNIVQNMTVQPVIDYQLFKICTQTKIIYEN